MKPVLLLGHGFLTVTTIVLAGLSFHNAQYGWGLANVALAGINAGLFARAVRL